MSNLSEWAKAFEIFYKYEKTSYVVDAEHDEIFVAVAPEKVSEEDEAKLKELGWNADSGSEYFQKFT